MTRAAAIRGAGAALLLGAAGAAWGAPALYGEAGGWGAVAGVPATAVPPDAGWLFEEGLWTGRIPDGAETLAFGDVALQVAEALPPPLAPGLLPATRSPFGACTVRSLSVRFDAEVRSRRWALVFPKEGRDSEFVPLELAGGRSVPIRMELEDAVSGRRWPLRPERMGRESGTGAKGDSRLYAGTVDDGDVDWLLVATPGAGGRVILQGRVLVLKSPERLLKVRLLLETGAPGAGLLQEESPPATVAATNGTAVALFADLAEPRRFRAVVDASGAWGVEIDLAATKATGNFPRSATFSLEADAWATAGADAAAQEAMERLPRAGGSVALPDSVARDGLAGVPAIEASRMRLAHPAGFADATDAVAYLMLKTSGLFSDFGWASSAFFCAAQDARGAKRISAAGQEVVLAVNPDPDLETTLETGPNRGVAVLERVRKAAAPAVWIRAAGASPGLDHREQALYLCDYPAVWEEGSGTPAADLRHAEAELIAALACRLEESGTCLMVSDDGPLAPFTTYHADVLVCESADGDEMRRQRALAGLRPVLWTAANAGAEAEALARKLGFARPGTTEKD